MSVIPRLRYLLSVLAVSAITCSAAQAIVVTLNVETGIVSMNLQGTSPLPLGMGSGSPGFDYRLVDTLVTLTESASLASTGTTSIVFDLDTLTSTVTSNFELFVDLSFADADTDPGDDFAPGLTDPFNILADPNKPLTVMLQSSLLLTDPVVDLGTLALSNTISHSLGVDINGNGPIDGISFSAADLSFDINDIDFTTIDFSGAVIDPVTFDVTLDLQGGVGITSSSVIFSGMVADNITDPPFTIELSGDVGSAGVQAPAPSTGLLVSLGLLGLLVARRHQRLL